MGDEFMCQLLVSFRASRLGETCAVLFAQLHGHTNRYKQYSEYSDAEADRWLASVYRNFPVDSTTSADLGRSSMSKHSRPSSPNANMACFMSPDPPDPPPSEADPFQRLKPPENGGLITFGEVQKGGRMAEVCADSAGRWSGMHLGLSEEVLWCLGPFRAHHVMPLH